MKLPPSTPVRKGEKPGRGSSVKKLKTPQTNSPRKSLLKRKSPTPVKAKLAKKLGLFSPKGNQGMIKKFLRDNFNAI